jgi:hypothetical protein
LSHNLLSVNVWAVIVGDRDGLGLQALANTDATILDASKLATGILSSAGAVRGLESVAARTKIDLAVRSGTVVAGVATPSLLA